MAKKKGVISLIHPIKSSNTFGQSAADKLTKWAGSWTFIITFLIFIMMWMVVNATWIIFGRTWDVYPFILLNLVLSCLAALQAPIILMSQNRQAEKDRHKAEYDYQVNKKAEKEIQGLVVDMQDIKRALKINRRKKR